MNRDRSPKRRSPTKRRSPLRSGGFKELEAALPNVRTEKYKTSLASNNSMFRFLIPDNVNRLEEEEIYELDDIFNTYRFDARVVMDHPYYLQYDERQSVSDDMLLDLLVFSLKHHLYNVYTLNYQLKRESSPFRIILMDREAGLEDQPTNFYFDIIRGNMVRHFTTELGND
jgi:hypothetical protein